MVKPLWKTLWSFHKKLKIELPPQLVWESRVLKRYLYTYVHSSTVHNSQRWKQPKRPLTHEWKTKMWYIHTVIYHSALRWKEILTHATTWMNPKDIMLSKRSQSQASLVAQWLRICLPMQVTWVRALVWEDPTCRGATRPVSHNY